MIYLSIQSASTLVKENFEVNGSVSDCKVLSELKILLERYAMSLGFSFSDALGVVMEISSGKKSLEVWLMIASPSLTECLFVGSLLHL